MISNDTDRDACSIVQLTNNLSSKSIYIINSHFNIWFIQSQEGHSIDSHTSTSGNPAADYSEGASHVLAVIHQILGHHRALEARWHARKVKLHQRLALKYENNKSCVLFDSNAYNYDFQIITRCTHGA